MPYRLWSSIPFLHIKEPYEDSFLTITSRPTLKGWHCFFDLFIPLVFRSSDSPAIMCRPIVAGVHHLGCNHFQKSQDIGDIDCYNPRCIYSDRHMHPEAGRNCTDPQCIKTWEPDAQQVLSKTIEKCTYCRQASRRRWVLVMNVAWFTSWTFMTSESLPLCTLLAILAFIACTTSLHSLDRRILQSWVYTMYASSMLYHFYALSMGMNH